MCIGYSKELSHLDGSFQYSQLMFWFRNKKNNFQIHSYLEACTDLQVELFREDRKEEIKRNLPVILEGKKAKRRKVLEERQKKGEIIDEAELEKEIDFDVDDVHIPRIKPEHALVQIHLGTYSA